LGVGSTSNLEDLLLELNQLGETIPPSLGKLIPATARPCP
jgi:hypothetical protein